jgi:hypothetical protein
MTREQAAKLVELLFAAFPFPRPPLDTFELYHRELLALDYGTAQEVVQKLVRGEQRLPPLAVVLREYRAIRRRLAVEQAEERGLPEPEPDPEAAAKARAYLARLEEAG